MCVQDLMYSKIIFLQSNTPISIASAQEKNQSRMSFGSMFFLKKENSEFLKKKLYVP